VKFDAREHKEFFDDIKEEGYHIFSRQKAKTPGFYPNAFPTYPKIDILEIKENDVITIRAFFALSKNASPQIDGGHIDLEVEYVDQEAKTLFGNIITELPATFALSKGTSIELNLDEILFVHAR